MTAIDILGYFGIAMMMACFVPQLIKTIKEGHADSWSLGYILLAELGMISLFIFVLSTSRSTQLLISYAYNILAFGTMLKYKLRPRTHGGTGRRG